MKENKRDILAFLEILKLPEYNVNHNGNYRPQSPSPQVHKAQNSVQLTASIPKDKRCKSFSNGNNTIIAVEKFALSILKGIGEILNRIEEHPDSKYIFFFFKDYIENIALWANVSF